MRAGECRQENRRFGNDAGKLWGLESWENVLGEWL